MLPGIGNAQTDILHKGAGRKDAPDRHGENKDPGEAIRTSRAGDIFSRGAGRTEHPTYVKNAADDVHPETRFLFLRDLVGRTFAMQGMSTAIDAGEGKTVDILQLSPEEAKEITREDGYWGVEQTSERIFRFAVSSIGNDPEKIEKIKDGINKGFRMAQQAFAMALPGISSKTYDAVMTKLDAWGKDPGTGAAPTA